MSNYNLGDPISIKGVDGTCYFVEDTNAGIHYSTNNPLMLNCVNLYFALEINVNGIIPVYPLGQPIYVSDDDGDPKIWTLGRFTEFCGDGKVRLHNNEKWKYSRLPTYQELVDNNFDPNKWEYEG